MNSDKIIWRWLLFINVLAFFILVLNQCIIKEENTTPNPTSKLRSFTVINEEPRLKLSPSPYTFNDPKVAQYLLNELDIFEVLTLEEYSLGNYKKTASGFSINNDYCKQHRKLFINNPEIVFNRKNVITNFWHHHKIRSQVLRAIGAKDIHPEVYLSKKNRGSFRHQMKLEANVYFMHNFFYEVRQVGVQYSCLSQASNHIAGHDKLFRKDYFAQSVVEYAESYQTRPECFSYKEHFPKSWVMRNQSQCLAFFSEFDSPRYQELKKERNIVYFRKIGNDVHKGFGVFPVSPKEETYIRDMYQNGTLCGQAVEENNLIQVNVYNPILIKGRKFHFRQYLLVASTNPVIAYYHDGYLRLSIDEYTTNSTEIRTFITNIGPNLKDALEAGLLGGMNAQQIEDYTTFFLEQFQDYLLEKKLIQDPNWLNNHLRPQFKKIMVHLVRISQSSFAKKSSLFELFGLDFIMDENLSLWFIEANCQPLMDGFTKESTVLLNQMLGDMFEIVFGLLRSRMKRVVNYINGLTEELKLTGSFTDVDKKREVFRRLTMNRFENEYRPSPNNTFHQILDENKEGTERYFGFIEEKCL